MRPRTTPDVAEAPISSAAPRLVGFWRDPHAPRTATLPDPRDLVDPTWSRAERRRLARYLQQGRLLHDFQGFSWCRFRCGVSDRRMGHRDLTDGVYVWPEGLPHYVKAHAVRLPDDFLAHVRAQLAHEPAQRGVMARIRRLLGARRPGRPS